MRTRADVIEELDLPSGKVKIDEAGYLVETSSWSPEFSEKVAETEGIEITKLHWQVIDFMRSYLTDHGVSPDFRHVQGFLMKTLVLDKRGAKAKFYDLFPAGHVQHACKIAGMRQPRAWSTG